MLVQFTELQQTDGFYEDAQREIARDSTVLDGVDAAELQNYSGPCCWLKTTCDESPLAVVGSLNDLLGLLHRAEVTAAEKLEAIREIIAEADE